MKIIEYITITRLVGNNAEGSWRPIDNLINSKIKEGYQPFGNLSIFTQYDNSGTGFVYYCQPMVKYEN